MDLLFLRRIRAYLKGVMIGRISYRLCLMPSSQMAISNRKNERFLVFLGILGILAILGILETLGFLENLKKCRRSSSFGFSISISS